MPNRFTKTEKWDDIWFKSLTPLQKVCFIFLCDRCDLAGFYELDLDDMAYRIKATESDILGAVEGLLRGLIIEKGKKIESGNFVWIKNFLYHQRNLPLNPSNNAHASIIFHISTKINRFPDIPDILGADKGLFSSYGKGKGNGNGNGILLKTDEFEKFWIAYDKKVGNKKKLLKKFSKLSDKEIEGIFKYIPKYKEAQPDKKFRKNPETFLNNKSWNDEIIIAEPKTNDPIVEF